MDEFTFPAPCLQTRSGKLSNEIVTMHSRPKESIVVLIILDCRLQDKESQDVKVEE